MVQDVEVKAAQELAQKLEQIKQDYADAKAKAVEEQVCMLSPAVLI